MVVPFYLARRVFRRVKRRNTDPSN
jgi:hypothetical protein